MRVGGSSWRPKIDPKRPQEKKHNDFEEDRTRRGEKKDAEDDKKREDELPKCFESVWPANEEKEAGGVWSTEAPREPPYSRG